jgi:transposase
LYKKDGILGLAWHGPPGLSCQINVEQQEKLRAWVLLESSRTTRQIGSYILQEFGVAYESRSGLIALLHRLGLVYQKPKIIPRNLDIKEQQAFSLLTQFTQLTRRVLPVVGLLRMRLLRSNK